MIVAPTRCSPTGMAGKLMASMALVVLIGTAALAVAEVTNCGCPQTCTSEALNAVMAVGTGAPSSCRDRINYLMLFQSNDEISACTRVASICGISCDPRACPDSTMKVPLAATSYCSCATCTQGVWDAMTIDYTCGARITWLIEHEGYSDVDACTLVAESQFPAQCGKCNPKTCPKDGVPPPVVPPVVTNSPHVVSMSPPAPSPAKHVCGCSSCTEELLAATADGYSCRARIDYLLTHRPDLYPTEADACRLVVGVEFARQCSAVQCDPNQCNNGAPIVTPPSESPVTLPTDTTEPLYCFPPTLSRKMFTSVWSGNYTLEVKEGDVCGPRENRFSRSTVSHNQSSGELKLEFRYNEAVGSWDAAEVRLLLPPDKMPFSYGKYSFSIKRVQVLDLPLGSNINSTVLPPGIVLGLFTWDPTDDYSMRENFSHEVDIEISRWGTKSNADAQFLVQPPGSPQQLRFFSGATGSTYQQGGNTYEFMWAPGSIQWSTTAGGGRNHTYSVSDALAVGAPDYVQCLPAKVEVRMNLWHIHGSSQQPDELSKNQVVQVIIDNFTYTPSGLTGLAVGGTCTKSCQCQPNLSCDDNRCAAKTRCRGAPASLPAPSPELGGQGNLRKLRSEASS
jgi:hypothetical protein